MTDESDERAHSNNPETRGRLPRQTFERAHRHQAEPSVNGRHPNHRPFHSPRTTPGQHDFWSSEDSAPPRVPATGGPFLIGSASETAFAHERPVRRENRSRSDCSSWRVGGGAVAKVPDGTLCDGTPRPRPEKPINRAQRAHRPEGTRFRPAIRTGRTPF